MRNATSVSQIEQLTGYARKTLEDPSLLLTLPIKHSAFAIVSIVCAALRRSEPALPPRHTGLTRKIEAAVAMRG